MSTFYKPLTTNIFNVPVIVYPMKTLKNVLNPSKPMTLENHLKDLYEQESYLQSGSFHIVILWSDNSEIMTDVWIYHELESEEAGYTIDCKTFRSLKIESGSGITASDGLIMLGRESELSESIRKEGGSVADYINAERPMLPGKLRPSVYWYR